MHNLTPNTKYKMKYLKKAQKIQIVIIITTLLFLIFSLFFDNYLNENMAVFHSDYFNLIFNVLSNFYLLIFVLVVLTTVFMYIEKKKEGILPLWASFILTVFITGALKFLVARERPSELFDIGIVIYSFPSMHAAVCFAVVPILDWEFPKLKVFWITLGVLVGLSRIYLQVHYLSDVVAGALIGYVIGLVVFYLHEKYFYRIKW